MTPTEVLKMLKNKIDAAGLNKCNYAIETSDIEAINQALLLYDVVGRSEQLSLCQCDKPSPDIMYGETCTECYLQIATKA